jgi:imidazolonepropionase-like amidohydrolase
MEAKEKPGAAGTSAIPRDVRYEAMIPVLKGQQVVFIEVQSDQDIRKAVQFAREQKLNYVLLGADDAPKVADFLQENGVRVILGPPDPLPIREDDPVDGVCRAAAVLHEHGVSFAMATGRGGADDRNLRHQAGMTVGCGLPCDVALRAVTLTPAEFTGVAGMVGSIEKGKRADLVLTDGDILEYGTHITQTFVNGKPAGVQSRYTELYDKYKDRK